MYLMLNFKRQMYLCWDQLDPAKLSWLQKLMVEKAKSPVFLSSQLFHEPADSLGGKIQGRIDLRAFGPQPCQIERAGFQDLKDGQRENLRSLLRPNVADQRAETETFDDMVDQIDMAEVADCARHDPAEGRTDLSGVGIFFPEVTSSLTRLLLFRVPEALDLVDIDMAADGLFESI